MKQQGVEGEVARPGVEALRERLSLPDTLHASETIRPAFRAGPIVAPPPETQPPETHAEAPGVVLVPRADDLRYVRTLGEGGMGRVFLARQPSLHRGVAVKTATDSRLHSALVAEAVITGMLEHPNIPPVHQLGEDAHGNPVLVMKRIEGASWSEVLADPRHPVREDNPLFGGEELDAHLEILVQVCNALHFAHTRGVIHRDVKPANVMIGSFGEVMLIDWGVAYSREVHGVFEQHGVVGSPAYMAPEMVHGEEPDARTDVYLLGSTLHELLTGKARHAASSAWSAILSVVESKPVEYDATVPTALAALANRATSAARDERPASALEFAQAIRRYLQLRSASELADRAAESLEALEETLQRGEGADDDAIDQLAIQCRFALHESLRKWPENPLALAMQKGLPRLLVEHAIARGDLASARRHLAELRSLDVLEPRHADAVARLEAQEAERDRRERERDLEAGRRQREGLFALLVLGIVPVQVYRTFVRPWSSVPPEDAHLELLGVWGFTLLPPALLLLVLRRRVARTEEGRHLVDLYLALAATTLVHRLFALVREPGVANVMSGDMLLGGLAFVIGSLWLGRPFLLPALALFAGAAGAVVSPAHFGPMTNAATVVAVVALIWAQRRVARARAAPPPLT
ncbi:MAG: serine/threonine protein kinase [Myxococcales bacterium]|nr:serine/threonine protein kinase [Myxococcales bacterium]